MTIRGRLAILTACVVAGGATARAASLSVGSIAMPPNATSTFTVSGSISGQSTYGVTILVELVPQGSVTGTLTFTPAPPTDIFQAGDPWPGTGTFSAFDTDLSGSATLNGTVDDNGTFVPGVVNYTGPLSRFPVQSSATADGVWVVLLSTSAGASGWEGLTTTLVAGTITVTAGACVVDGDCDDGDVCTTDQCNAGVCQNINNTASCNDGVNCTTGDVCGGGVCAGTPVDCSFLTNTCNVGTCNPATGMCEAVPTNEGGMCNDGNLCTTGDICSSGTCAGTPVDCTSLSNACNVGTCNMSTGLCEAIPANKGGPCNDGNNCTINDSCAGGVCSGTPVDCSSLDDACNDGLCNASTGMCQANPINEGGPCDDGDLCTQNDRCTAGVCAGTAVNCSALTNTCNLGVCNASTGVCEAMPVNNGGVCNDNNACTSNDVCSNGVCAGTPIAGCDPCVTSADCNDGNVCTTDSCHPAGVCIYTNNTNPCDDGLFCTANDVCSNGTCVGTGNPCTGQLCDEDMNACVDCLVDADCNDGNVCTTDTCVGGACQYASNSLPCNDGLFCTLTDVCSGGSCVGSGNSCPGLLCNESTDACVECLDNSDCNDGNVCTTDVCNAGVCENTNNTLPCNDGFFCTATDTCVGGACVGSGDPCPGQLCSDKLDMCVECLSNADCDDTNPCTDDTCTVGVCGYANNTNPCDDSQFCTVTDQCSGGACVGTGTPCPGQLCDEAGDACVDCLAHADCDDGNPCTDDTCGGGLCQNVNNTSPCSDGFFCTQTDVCTGGVCVGSGDPCPGQLCDEFTNSCVDCLADADCDDGNPCTDDSCVGGACDIQNNTDPCDDGMFCTAIDACSGGSCVGSGDSCPGQLCDETTDTCVDCLINAGCSDGNVCTTDSCIAGVCSNTNNSEPCNDGLFCTATDVCTGGVCTGTGDRCPGQLCNESLDACVNCLNDADCNDNNLCTNDSCVSGACQYVNNTQPCNDGSLCTVNDRCAGGACVGTPVDCSALNTACIDGTCNPATGQCEPVNINEGGPCDDGDLCTANDTCAAGACSGSAVDCSGFSGPCSQGTCDTATGTCEATPINEGQACNDGNICTSTDQCVGGFCIGTLMQGCQPCSTAANCNDSNVCTSDHCHPIGVCYHGNVAGSCDDGDPCTSNDVCSAGVCSGADIPGCINCASAAECNDNNPCTSNTCVGGVCQFPPDDGIACDDGNICTETDTCSGGICAGTPISGCDACTVHADCNDGNPCTTDSCHPLGVCIYANNKLPCNDGIACTQNDICSGGICAGTSTPDGGACDDGSVCTAGETCTGGVCGGGTPTNEGATCNDGNLCTLNDTCAAGVCAGTPMDCSALNDQCNVGQCNPTTGACEPVAINEGGPCSDGQACTENDTCVNGVCETTPIDCSMLNGPCGTGVCNASTGLCEVVPMNEGQPCDDGSVCTANDSCVNGFCTGPGVDCSGLDGPCVRGACHPIAGVCEALPANEGGACNDSDLCTTGDVCTGGACGGTPVDCSGLATVCRSAACNPSTGSCETTSINKGAACDDGNLCTQTDVCTGGVCAGMPADCSALNSGCLVGVCNTGTGACEQVPAGEGGACDDGNLCTQNDICISGSCAGTAVNCSSLNTACTLGVCNGSTGQCQAIPTNPGGSCNDNNRCTINDRCNAGVCSGTPKDCSAFTDACNIGTCNLVNGQCEATPANEGAPCNDGLACTINDVCVNGDCEGTSLNPETVSLIWSPPSQTIMIGSTFQVTLIARSDTCFTIDVGSIQAILNWDETRIRFLGHTDNGPYAWIYSGFPNDQSLDGLNAPFNGTIANDGDALYQAIASFVNGAPASPSGLTVTTFTFEALGLASNTVVTIPPAMGNYSVSEVLGEGIDEDITGSLGTATVSVVECTTKGQCNDGNPCTTDACVSGVCVHTNNSLPCSDGLFCTANDVCSGGTCVGGANPCSGGLLCSETLDACVQCLTNANCNDGNVCTTDTCNSSGTCVFTNNSASCNDGLFCTPTDTCSGGTCQGGGIACPGQFCNETLDACVECLTNAHCNDGNVCTTDSCNASGSCVHANNTAACDDGQFCTVTDICSNGSCVGSGTPCLGGLFCNEANDTCVQCLTNGHCGDGNVCTTDTCVSGSCQHSNNTFSCDDGLFCTTGDACSNGACVSGSGVNCPGLLCDEAGNRCVECFTASDCNDGAACSTEQCNNGVCNYTLDHASCNDGLFCTGVETCVVDTGCVSPGSPCDSPALCDEASDFCRCGAPTAVTDGPRHVGVTPAGGATPVAILVDSADPDLFCLPKYVAADGRFSDTPVFRTPAQWGTVHLADKYVEPATTYSIQSDCRAQPTDPENLSPPVSATTFLWGDIDNTGIPDVDDLIRMVQGFASLISYDADLVPCESDIVVDVDDLLAFVAAFGFAPYPCPAPCP